MIDLEETVKLLSTAPQKFNRILEKSGKMT